MKKDLTKDEQWLKFSAICIGVYLLVAVPLTLIFDWFTWHWFWFGFFVVYIPLAFFYMYFWSEKRVKPNEEQKKTAELNLCKYILLFWFYDLLYMAIFNQWLVLEYVFGIIAVIIIFSNLIKAFLSGIKFFKWMLPCDLLCGVGLSVYLIYRIPNETLQTIVLTIVAALYGGLLTLVGVAWTIKRQDENQDKTYGLKIKPVLILIENEMYNLNTPEDLMDLQKRYSYINRCEAFIENADFQSGIVLKNIGGGYCFIDKLYLNNTEVSIINRCYIEQNGIVVLDILGNKECFIDSDLLICVRDMENNLYKYELKIRAVRLDSISEIKAKE